jgi:hypothetical protein
MRASSRLFVVKTVPVAVSIYRITTGITSGQRFSAMVTMKHAARLKPRAPVAAPSIVS